MSIPQNPCMRIRVRRYARIGPTANPCYEADCVEGCYGDAH